MTPPPVCGQIKQFAKGGNFNDFTPLWILVFFQSCNSCKCLKIQQCAPFTRSGNRAWHNVSLFRRCLPTEDFVCSNQTMSASASVSIYWAAVDGGQFTGYLETHNFLTHCTFEHLNIGVWEEAEMCGFYLWTFEHWSVGGRDVWILGTDTRQHSQSVIRTWRHPSHSSSLTHVLK